MRSPRPSAYASCPPSPRHPQRPCAPPLRARPWRRHAAGDYLYREEFEAAEATGTLTALRTAFSRDAAAKVYVQTRLREDGALLYALIANKGAHVYICGGTAMGREVVALLTELHVTHGGKSASAAAAQIKKMTTSGRLVQELWS